jgi:hypothetical protein
MKMKNPSRGQPAGASISAKNEPPIDIRPQPNTQVELADVRLQSAVKRLHKCGPRPVYEMLVELAARRMLRTEIEALVFKYAAINLPALEAAGGRQFAPVPLHPIGNGR